MGDYPVLDKVSNPAELKRLDKSELESLCGELRNFLIENVSKTGGHLASSLGAVEINVGLHRVFSTPDDCVLFDVGHQAYVHKILTGRREQFDSLRMMNGISGFIRPSESPHDCFVSGHASNSISAALGMARARAIKNEKYKVVAVIGDGSLTGGMAYEALNDAGQYSEPIIIVVNDNEMSISKSVGAIAAGLRRLRLKPRYFKFKSFLKKKLGRIWGGDKLVKLASTVKNRVKAAVLKESIFELMGFKYLGPADGNDISTVCALLKEASNLNCPVVVHFKTVKGKGYKRSEISPGTFHGVEPFNMKTGKPINGKCKTFSDVFGEIMLDFAEKDKNVCAVTAAMTTGTGLREYSKTFPERFFDVGITEEHAVTMASGMACRGILPVCAIYSTFLQRSYDQLLHDVNIQQNHVVFAVDRAGVVPGDGQTHQGAFDVPYLLSVPNMVLFSPSSFREMKSAFNKALYEIPGPVAVRYPKSKEREYKEDTFGQDALVLKEGADITVISYGIMINEALKAAEILSAKGISAEIIKINCLSRYDFDIIKKSIEKTNKVLVLEDCAENGCLGQKIAAQLLRSNATAGYFKLLNLCRAAVAEGTVCELYKSAGIDGESAANEILRNAFGME